MPGLAGDSPNAVAVRDATKCSGLLLLMGSLVSPECLSILIGGEGGIPSSPRSTSNVLSGVSIAYIAIVYNSCPPISKSNIGQKFPKIVNSRSSSQVNKFI